MFKKYKETLNELGLSFKKEIITVSLINLCVIATGILIFLSIKNMMIVLIAIALIVAFNYLYLSRYPSFRKKLEKQRVDELISLLPYYELFISNGKNVYTALNMLIPYSSQYVGERITKLISQIDMDKSVEPFVNFAQEFKNNTIEYLMISIYQMIDNGGSSKQLEEFDMTFRSINNTYQISLVEDRKKSLDSLSSWPLFGAGAITIILSISLIGVIGEYINVL